MNLDTGNFRGADPYAEIARTGALRLQCPGQDRDPRRNGHAKEEADLAGSIGILREAATRATSSSNTRRREDPLTAIPRHTKTLRQLIS